ncbi:F-box protein-like [Iris pallida]|uniref:F-box protein-like n=1 Tax=Iris pallida TaxID=29817 RepID=A0AAX6HWW4_IRIPA|nr:F-box protein-like [Iris pallida]
MEKFPREVVCDILSRLPLKYVIQCICVCKTWLGIVRDPAFEELHFSRSESEPAILILAHHVIGGKDEEEEEEEEEEKKKKKEVVGISYMKQERLALVPGETLALVPGETAIGNIVSSHSWSFVGTCRGLLCFASPSEVVIVCNPVTREHVLLPEPTPCPKPYRVMLAFGFDPIAKKYKVVRLVCPPPERRPEVAAQVYTLGDAGSWRIVQGFNFNCAPRGRSVYASGAVHWLAHPHPDNPPPPPRHRHHPRHPYIQHLLAHQQIDHLGESILSFDLGKEAFEMAPHIRFGVESSLEELGKCVAVVDTSSTTLVEVSVLRDISQNHWQKEYILPVRKPRLCDRGSPRLICALEHDGVLLVWLQDSLLSYRRKGFLRRDLKLARFPTWLDWEICSGYRGSLVSLSHLSAGNGDHRSDDVSFVGDQELYAISSEDVVGGREEARRCDNIVNCFHENGMMLD